MAKETAEDWDSGVLDCFEDIDTCCYGFWCCPCLTFTVSNRFGECYYLPLCDICSPATFVPYRIPLFVPPATVGLRAAMRNRYNIKGSIFKDILVSCCCTTCAWCQMHRELKHQKKEPDVVNVQPAPMKMPAPPAGFVTQHAIRN